MIAVVNSLNNATIAYVRERNQSKQFQGSTAASIASRLRTFVRWCEDEGIEEVNGVDVEHVEAFLASDKRQSRASIRVRLSAVVGFYVWARRRGLCDHDPCDGVKPPKHTREVPRAFSKETVGQLLASVCDTRERLIVSLMLQEGLRCCEVANLEVTDIDRRERTMLVTGKGGHQRVLPILPPVVDALAVYEAEFPPLRFGPLIRSYRSSRRGITAGTISNIMRRVLTDAGIKQYPRDGVSAHALRHTAASDVLERCGDVRVVQEMLGHTSLTTTQIYLRRVGQDRLRAAMDGRTYRIA